MNRRSPGRSPRASQTVPTTTYATNGTAGLAGIAAYLLEHRGLPGDAGERLLERRVRDWLVGLPPIPARWVA